MKKYSLQEAIIWHLRYSLKSSPKLRSVEDVPLLNSASARYKLAPHGQLPALDYIDEKRLTLMRKVLHYLKQPIEEASNRHEYCNMEGVATTGKMAMNGSALELKASGS